MHLKEKTNMKIYTYTEELGNFLDLFNISLRDKDRLEDYLSESIQEELFYQFGENCDIGYDYVIYDKSISEIILDEIEYFLDTKVRPCFENKIEFNILPYEHNNKVNFTIKSDNLHSQIGSGMDGYGMWSWSLHSPEDQQTFLDDGYLALRELLHYYEACESKPSISFENIDFNNFWHLSESIESIKEEFQK